MREAKRLSPIILAIAAQAMAALLLVAIIQLSWRGFTLDIPWPAKLLFQSIAAGTLTLLMRLPRWWLWIQLALPPIFFTFLQLDLPGWSYLFPLLLLIALFWNSADDRVPLYLTSEKTADFLSRSVIADAPGRHGRRFIDLGCGPAGLLLRLARANPDWHFTGAETAPLLWLIAMLRAHLSGLPNIDIKRCNLWRLPLSNWDVVYAFLSPAPMPALYRKLTEEASSGTIFVSNSFIIPDHPADESHHLDDRRETILHIWHFPRG